MHRGPYHMMELCPHIDLHTAARSAFAWQHDTRPHLDVSWTRLCSRCRTPENSYGSACHQHLTILLPAMQLQGLLPWHRSHGHVRRI